MQLGRSVDAYQDFLLGCKLYWTGPMYRALRDNYRAKAEQIRRAGGEPPADADAVERLMGEDALYQYFGWLERHLQRFKYSGRYGLAPAHEPFREELLKFLDHPLPEGLLEIDPGFLPPEYFTRIDIHQHPGGLCGDELSGLVYERGARSTTPLLSKDRDLHHRLTSFVLSGGVPARILDVGCGFGKSTRPFYTELPEAQVTGVDIAAPCLKLAAVTAAEDQARNVRFRQRAGEESGFEGESFDLVTSTMLLHEMAPKAVQRLIAESFRVLAPGGRVVHLDFLTGDDPFDRFIHYGHSRRNNEPYMRPLNETDLVAAHEAAGFTDVEIQPFAEMPGALDGEPQAWRFPWVTISARRP